MWKNLLCGFETEKNASKLHVFCCLWKIFLENFTKALIWEKTERHLQDIKR